jgi:WD40 repeat protein/serine/threonine protein kinase
VNRDKYQRVSEIFHEAVALDGEARQAFLDKVCEGDAALRRRVELLLAHDQTSEDVFGEEKLGIGRRLLEPSKPGKADLSGRADGRTEWSPLPETIGRYRILERIGAGGMGTVYLAEQDHPRRAVALKMIRPGVMSPSLLRRFQQEADLLGRLQHPGVAQIYEAGEIDTQVGRQPYFAMEYVDGVQLRRYAEQHNLGTRERLELVARICDAVYHAHQKGIIHRDLKPDNILVVDEPPSTSVSRRGPFATLGQPKVLDFGVARATDSDIQMTTMQTDVGQLVGTITYMSPEQVLGDSRRLDTRSDIYAVGVMLYELLAGCPPFDLRHKSIPEAARMIREDEPTHLGSIRPVFRGDVETIVGKALEKDPGRRYQSAAELAVDIRRYLANEPITARPPSTFYQLRKFAKRHTGLVAGLALTFLVLVTGIISSLTFATRALSERRRAEGNEQRALKSEAAARYEAYHFSLAAAEGVSNTDPLKALAHLRSAPPEYRGWEWRHLAARLESHCAAYAGDRRAPYAATTARRPDGALIAALERGGTIELVDLASGDVRAVFSTPGGLAVPSLSPDGSRLAAIASTEAKLVVWDVGTADRLFELPATPIDAPRTRFSPDGSLIATMSREDGLVLREVATNRVRFQSGVKAAFADPLAFDSNGERVAVAHLEEGAHVYLSVYSVAGDLVAQQFFVDGCLSMAFSPDGTRLALGQGERMIRILDASTLATLRVLHGHAGAVTAVAFSPDGAYLASSSSDGTTRIWDSFSGETLRVLTGGDAASLAFAEDSSLLAAGSSAEARLWAWRHDALRVLRGHRNYVYIVNFSPDGSLIASSSWDDTVRLWDPLTGELLATFVAAQCYKAVGFTCDGTRLVALDASQPQYLSVWDSAAGLRLTAPRSASDESLFEILQNTNDDSLWRKYSRIAAGGAKIAPHEGQQYTSSRDGLQMASGADSGQIRIENIAAETTVAHIDAHDGRVFAVAFSPDGTRLISGGEDRTVKVWDLASGTQLAATSGHSGSVYSVNYSPDGSRIVSGGNDGTIRIWDAQTYEELIELHGHTSYVHSVCFSPDGTMLASGSGDGTVRIWDSVPPAERWRQIQQAKQLRREAEPLVDRLLEEFSNPLDVADHLRADESLSDDFRRAALRVLLKRSTADRPTEW